MHGSVKRFTYFREKSWCILQIIVVILEATDKPNTSK